MRDETMRYRHYHHRRNTNAPPNTRSPDPPTYHPTPRSLTTANTTSSSMRKRIIPFHRRVDRTDRTRYAHLIMRIAPHTPRTRYPRYRTSTRSHLHASHPHQPVRTSYPRWHDQHQPHYARAYTRSPDQSTPLTRTSTTMTHHLPTNISIWQSIPFIYRHDTDRHQMMTPTCHHPRTTRNDRTHLTHTKNHTSTTSSNTHRTSLHQTHATHTNIITTNSYPTDTTAYHHHRKYRHRRLRTKTKWRSRTAGRIDLTLHYGITTLQHYKGTTLQWLYIISSRCIHHAISRCHNLISQAISSSKIFLTFGTQTFFC